MNEFKLREAKDIAEHGSDEEVNRHLQRMTRVDRRVVSRKETIGYMFFDGSSGFNIDSQRELFVDSILQIDLKKQSQFNIFAGIWDIVDDIVIGGIIEKTRTRWGKFVPYFFLVGIPYAIVVGLYWMLPLFFSEEHVNDLNYIPKFIAFIVLELLMETVKNFRGVATAGYLSTITPYPSDRRRLLSVTKYFNLFYAGLPNTIVEFLLDFITNGLIKASPTRTTADMMKWALVILGPFTAVVTGLVTIWYSTLAKERVHQSIETPRIIDSLRVVYTNKPLLMYMISNSLGSFSTGITTNNYYRWILFMTTFETFAGIPSVFFQPLGYAKYNKLAAKYSTKRLYMLGYSIPKASYIPVFLYGLLIRDKDGNQLFKNRIAMFPVTALWEIVYASFQGIIGISRDEIQNECNDYIEWKTGHRNEAILQVASTIMCKIPERLNAVFTPLIKDWIGYDQNAYKNVQPQPERAQPWIFAMSTLFPAILAILSIVPMFGYKIDKATRDNMYAELNARRSETAQKITDAESDVSED